MENEEDKWTLDTIPVEVFLHISTFIPSASLLGSVSLVSKHFYQILRNEKTWAIRQAKVWGKQFPPIEQDTLPPTFYRVSSVKREQQIGLWKDPKELEFHPHIACVDAVHLFKQNSLLATGSRDRSIALINVNSFIEGSNMMVHKQNAHKGWIWDFASVEGHQIASGGWDCSVILWDYGEMLTPTQTFKTSSACLCLSSSSSESTMISAGTFDQKVLLFDTRAKTTVNEYRPHKKCVLSIGMEGGLIVTAGEDNRIALFDMKAGKVRSSFLLPSGNPKNYPKSISFAKTGNYPLHQFYVGDIRGNLHLIDLKTFTIRKTYEAMHKKAIQGVFHTLGAVLTCSSDGNLIIHEPSLALEPIHTIRIVNVELPKVHCLNNRVALAGGDNIVRLYYNLS